MAWLVLDLSLALAALVVLGWSVVHLVRRVKVLGRVVGATGEALAEANDTLAAAQAEGQTRRRVG